MFTRHRPLTGKRRLALVSAAALPLALAVSDLASSGSASAAARSSTPGLQSHSIYAASATAQIASDPASVELGTRFSVTTAGTVSGIRFFGPAITSSKRTASLWSATGTRLATATFAPSSRTGWQSVAFSTPVHVDAKTTYVASYQAPGTGYAFASRAFTKRVTHGDIVTPADAGVFVYGDNGGFPNQTYKHSSYYADVLFNPSGGSDSARTPSAPGEPASPSTQPTKSPAPTEPTKSPAPTEPTKSPVAPAPAPSAPTTAAYPNSSNTGVPSGTTLSPYTGSCVIKTAGVVIDSKTVNCDLTIQAANVVIKNSVINGTVADDENSTGYSFSITDSEVRVGNRPATGIGATNFTVRGVEVTGGNRSINCWINCTITDSYVHGQFKDSSGTYHESGIRMGLGGTIVHNTIACDAPDVPPDAGCSAGLTGYGDFAAVKDMLVQNNMFAATTGGTCAYGGSSAGKPYSNGASNIRFIGNVFAHGTSGKCGVWFAITDFDKSAPGNVWQNNTWDDGKAVPAA